MSDLGAPVLDLLSPLAGERVLDLGCGGGLLTNRLLELGCQGIGVDSSPEMVAAARRLGVDARVMDGQALQFEGEFDAVFSNAALHWMSQPSRVVEGVWRALKPGGRFVGEFDGFGNVETIVRALEAALAVRGIDAGALYPWFFPHADEYRALLESHGFRVIDAHMFRRPTPLPSDITGWLETFGQSFVRTLPAEMKTGAIAEVADRLRPLLCDGDGRWVADYVRIRFAAIKPAN